MPSEIPEPVSRTPCLHWDKLRHRPTPPGVLSLLWWAAIKVRRLASYLPLPLEDKSGEPFVFFPTDTVQELLHQIDRLSGASDAITGAPGHEPGRDRFQVSSTMEEAIASSLLEGAADDRETRLAR